MSVSFRCTTLLSVLLLTTACAEFHGEMGDQGCPVVEDVAQAMSPLDLVNLTSDQYLEDVVGLPGAVADELVHLRLGADRIPGTLDDVSFTHLDQLLEVKGLSWGSIEKLFRAARLTGWVPKANEIMGAWDKVWFSATEAEHVLRFVNQLKLEVLNDALELDIRAAESIVAAQPIADLDQLVGLYFVGTQTLEVLKAAASAVVKAPQDTIL